MSQFIVFDTETTGLSNEDTVCQIAIALVNSQTLIVNDWAVSLINPLRPIKAHATDIHHITDDMVQGCPTLPEFLAQSGAWHWFSQVSLLCGHNVSFDIRMCQAHLPRTDFQVLDTAKLARVLYPKLRNHKLQTLVSELNLPMRLAHDARGDVQSCLDFLGLVADERSIYDLLNLTQNAHQQARASVLKQLGINQ